MNKRNYAWLITGVLGLCSFALGVHGFEILFETMKQDRNTYDLWFSSLGLFGMDFPDSFKSPLPVTLEIARWLSPLVVLYTAIITAITVLHNQFGLFVLRFKNKHIIVSAFNMQADYLIKDLINNKHKVVVIVDPKEFKNKSTTSNRRITCIEGDIQSNSFLKKIVAHKSNAIVFINESDDRNLVETYAAYEYLKSKGKDRKHLLLTHVANDLKMAELEDIQFFKNYSAQNMNVNNCQIRTFSSKERAARVLFNEFSPDNYINISSPEDPQMHIALIGSGMLAQSVLLRFARMGHYANLKKMNITLFHEDKKMVTRLERNVKPIRQFVDLNLNQEDLDIFDWEEFEQIYKKHPFSAVYILCEDDSLSTNILNKLAKIDFSEKLNVIMSLVEPNGILTKWYDVKYLNRLIIHKFNVIEKVFTHESLFNEKLDELAKFIHSDYLNNLDEKTKNNPNKRPTQYPWDELSNENKNANREQADHIAIKARAIGDSSETLEGLRNLSDEQIEILSEMEHNRWWANKALSGHVYGPKKDDSKKIHCDMISYAELSEETKEYDRNTIRNIPELLKRKKEQEEIK